MAVVQTPTPQQMVAKYLQAEMDVLEGKTTIFGGRTLTMADLPDIRAGRLEWERRVSTQAAQVRGGRGYSLASFE